jgi:glycosyltransferase involved in cell wall biosynthesis
MKVALVDNMNNNFFALARYFRDLGVEADLFLIPGRSTTHFDPKEDTWQDIENAPWIIDFPLRYENTSYLRSVKKSMRDVFCNYDKIIACGASVGLFYKAGIDVDMLIPYGSDLYNLPFPNHESTLSVRKIFRYPLEEYRSSLQKLGIQRAKTIIVNTNWSVASQALLKLNCAAINYPRVMIYKEQHPASQSQKYSWLSDYDFTIFSPTRHLWATNSEPMDDFIQNGGAKRNDKLLRAFARLVSSDIVQRPLLLLCEYGADVDYSKRLIADLKMDDYVKWLPLLPRKEIFIIMSYVSAVADQFREGMSATSAGTTNEALASGRPIIANTDGAISDLLDPYYSCPILQALSETEIYHWLSELASSPEFAKRKGIEGAEWFDSNLGVGLAEKYINVLLTR